MLEVRNLSFEYHEKDLFSNLNFQVPEGGLLHLCGKNGAGKTTLLRLLAGLFLPDSGEILYAGKNIHKDLSFFQQEICFVGHKSGIHPALTVAENCYFDLKSDHSPAWIADFLIQQGMQDLSDRLSANLSAGQQRKVALLRLCLSSARIWLLDEPLVALDKTLIDWFGKQIEAKRLSGGMVILSSHQALPESIRNAEEYWL